MNSTMNVDRLTKLLAAGYLEEPLEIEIARAQRYQRELGFILMEPHSPGSYGGQSYEALKKLASVSRVHTRKVDVLVRWGNGVLLIMPETPRVGLEVVVEKLVDAFNALEFEEEKPELRSAIVTYSEFDSENQELPGNIKPRDMILERLKVAMREAKDGATPQPSTMPSD